MKIPMTEFFSGRGRGQAVVGLLFFAAALVFYAISKM